MAHHNHARQFTDLRIPTARRRVSSFFLHNSSFLPHPFPAMTPDFGQRLPAKRTSRRQLAHRAFETGWLAVRPRYSL